MHTTHMHACKIYIHRHTLPYAFRHTITHVAIINLHCIRTYECTDEFTRVVILIKWLHTYVYRYVATSDLP